VFHTAVAAPLQDVDETDEVAVDVGVGVFKGVTDPGLGSQVHHLGKSLRSEEGRNRRPIGQIYLYESETWASLELRQTRLFEADVVVIVKVVEADDFVASVEQAHCQVIPDEPGRAGDQQLCHSKNPFFSRRQTRIRADKTESSTLVVMF